MLNIDFVMQFFVNVIKTGACPETLLCQEFSYVLISELLVRL